MSRKVSLSARELRGNPSGKPIPSPIEGMGELWEPPRWFKAAHKAKWTAVLTSAPRGLLTETDRDLVVAWCVAAVAHAEAVQRMYKTGGLVIESDYGPRQNPYLTVVNKQAEYMLSLSKQLGFNPASRAILGAAREGFTAGAVAVEGSVVAFLDQKPPSLAS